jgi:hypothetical protein
VIDITPTVVAEVSAAPATGMMEACVRNVEEEADAFARTTFRPSRTRRVVLEEIPAAYRGWCRKRGLEPLPDIAMGSALSALFSSVGLYRNGDGAAAAIVGIDWKDLHRAAPQRRLPGPTPRLGPMAKRAKA